jgi:hypothetical protein
MDGPPPALHKPRGAMDIDDNFEIPRRARCLGSAPEYILLDAESDAESRLGGGVTKTSTTTISPCITAPSANTNTSANPPHTRSADTSKEKTREIGGALCKEIGILDDISAASSITQMTAAAINKKGNRKKVVKQALLDPDGHKGVYNGYVLRSTGMPDGSGRMVYGDGRMYEGDWCVSFFLLFQVCGRM